MAEGKNSMRPGGLEESTVVGRKAQGRVVTQARRSHSDHQAHEHTGRTGQAGRQAEKGRKRAEGWPQGGLQHPWLVGAIDIVCGISISYACDLSWCWNTAIHDIMAVELHVHVRATHCIMPA